MSAGTKVWAHRGASGYAPENTLEAFTLAASMGADGVELDVQLTKDGKLVVAHDEWIDRVSNGSGRIADYTLEELKKLQFKKTHPDYEGECRIPTLREVFECLKDTNLTVNIELKTGVIYYKDIEKKTVALVHEMGYENRVLYSSFNHRSVLKVREFDPDAKLAFLYSHQLSGVAGYAKMNGVSAVNPSVLCTHLEDEMHDCLKNNIDIHVWTVNSEDEMHRLCKMGVSAIITNYPDVAKSICEEEKSGV
nr:glycerophosphodiester phosphodiesterase [uncultured Roseburia sp.]